MILGIDLWVAAILAATLLVGAAVQGLVGLGLGLIAAPVTTLLAPELMPTLLLWLAFFLPMVTLARDHHQIDWSGLGWSLTARIPGTVVGVLLVARFTPREMGVAVGIMVLGSVLLTARAVRLPINRATLVTAGVVSGVTGTATSIGGPPLALLYQHREPAQIRSTLAVFFLVGAAISLAGLGIGGQLEPGTFVLALVMVPLLVVGFAVSRGARMFLAPSHVRVGVLWVCGLSAAVVLVRSLVS